VPDHAIMCMVLRQRFGRGVVGDVYRCTKRTGDGVAVYDSLDVEAKVERVIYD